MCARTCPMEARGGKPKSCFITCCPVPLRWGVLLNLELDSYGASPSSPPGPTLHWTGVTQIEHGSWGFQLSAHRASLGTYWATSAALPPYFWLELEGAISAKMASWQAASLCHSPSTGVKESQHHSWLLHERWGTSCLFSNALYLLTHHPSPLPNS